MRPALGQHFDPALVDPVEDAKLVCDAVVVGGPQPTELEVREEGREIVLTRRSPTGAVAPHSSKSSASANDAKASFSGERVSDEIECASRANGSRASQSSTSSRRREPS
jgi:hypothetical protein